MGPSVTVLENQYFLLRDSLSKLMGRGATPAQLDALRIEIVRSRSNYWKATASIFHDDDPTVEGLVSQMNMEQLSLNATIEHLDKVADIINAITKAVDIGSKLIEKAVSL